MRVLLSPPPEPSDRNPYLSLLINAVEKAGARVDRYSLRRLLSGNYDVWHLHWPENVLLEKQPAYPTMKFLTRLALAKARGIKIVWTAHNLQPHEPVHPVLVAGFWRVFSTLVDGVFSLSTTGGKLLAEHHPALARKLLSVTPHGDYRSSYPNQLSRVEARAKLQLPERCTVILFFGRILRYKNVSSLIDSFRGLSDPDIRLVIAGACAEASLQAELRTRAGDDERIVLRLNTVSDEDTQAYFNSANLVALPFTNILNSGSVLLALGFNVPVLSKHSGALPELQGIVGKEWIRLLPDSLTSNALHDAVQWALHEPRPTACPLEAFAWDTIGEQTVVGYQQVLSTAVPSGALA